MPWSPVVMDLDTCIYMEVSTLSLAEDDMKSNILESKKYPGFADVLAETVQKVEFEKSNIWYLGTFRIMRTNSVLVARPHD